ncbi:MAG: heavy-metal-associated domain-containing protein [Clostridia bacterium]|nr:heavy-metal-associated domain-containing protein [Clostridia bacterium]
MGQGYVTKVLKLGGLQEPDDKRDIEENLPLIDGVDKATVDLQAKELELTFDPAVITLGYLAETLNSLGYSIQGDKQPLG